MDEEANDQESRVEDVRPRRGGYPRFGSFVTIAIALLMLFGAASRFGKVPETAALFGIDMHADRRVRDEEARIQAALSIGARPMPMEDLRPQSGRLPITPNATMPPLPRGGVDLDGRNRPSSQGGGRSQMSLTIPSDLWSEDSSQGRDVPQPQQQVQPPVHQQEVYVVTNGDTLAKIALRTLGDGKRWQEILGANPNAKEGLKVGMKLVIPN